MLPKNHNPFEFRDAQKKLQEANERANNLEERIRAVLEGEKPTDPRSWEYFIWKRYKDPLSWFR